MASKSSVEPDYCWESGKVRYSTKQQAYKSAKNLQGPRGRALMEVYKCRWCKGYHLTHKSRVL